LVNPITRHPGQSRDPVTLRNALKLKVAGRRAASYGLPFGPSAAPMFPGSCLRSPDIASRLRSQDRKRERRSDA